MQEVTRANKGWALDSAFIFNEMTKHMKEDISMPPEKVRLPYEQKKKTFEIEMPCRSSHPNVVAFAPLII